MTILVIGANGLVGSSLVRTCLDREHEVIGTYHTERPDFDIELLELDLRDSDRIRAVVERVAPTAVVNCAAYTDVDGCEQNPETAHAVNAEGPGVLAEVCAERDVSFVHFSTDYVFGGEAEEPYTEDDDPNPIQVYGETKLEGEQRVLEAHSGAIVCRLSFVWGRHGATGDPEGFPAWVLGRAQSGEVVPLFTDQKVTPTRAGDASEVVLELLECDVAGLFHVASQDCVTPYEFGRLILEEKEPSTTGLLEESSLEDVERAAPRPGYTCLSTDRVVKSLGHDRPTVEAAVSTVLSTEN
ncbi:dTDP-4-dehydrorhamnose reductase [Natronorubrum bangense]|uniref:dTDP-4-dehydrorhamnose reductase n=1 Tax=Natronorubrum bangense JCM 10635 TaxID=1227500 RepID=L9VZZ8_9EURY|nr:dTDP-4-dehydrorhamnose reductase [Natronorubrum bangense]ELY42642.1 dTDP-4-dehydrorhamnose reductase [Natronorubrum bangense JCM 10635]